jgi:hypothetical protein
MGRCLGYVAFESHANILINWEPSTHRDPENKKTKKKGVRYAEVTNAKQAFMGWFHYKPTQNTLPYLN